MTWCFVSSCCTELCCAVVIVLKYCTLALCYTLPGTPPVRIAPSGLDLVCLTVKHFTACPYCVRNKGTLLEYKEPVSFWQTPVV